MRLDAGHPLELFNLKTDCGEQTDVAARHPEIVARMETILATARTDSPDWPIKNRAKTKSKKAKGL